MKTARPYQLRAVGFLTKPLRQRGFIISPAGSGKTFMAALAVKEVAEAFARVYVLVNTREQCQQMREAFDSVGLCPTIEVTIACVASRPVVDGYDIVVGDEFHHLPAKSWFATVMFFKGIIWGFSATPWNRANPDRDTEIKLFFGEGNFLTIPREEVQAGGSITKGVVRVHDIDHEGAFDENIESLAAAETLLRAKKYPGVPVEEHHRRCLWQFTAEAVRMNFARNRMIEMLACQSEVSTLILVGSIEHGELLAEKIPGSIVVFSRMGKKKRAAAIDGFRDGTIRVMIATSLADEGLDVPRAAVLILAAGGRSEGKLEQRAGRVMRPHHTKTFGVVHDFADRGAKMAHSQFKSRARTYKQLGYEIS